MAKTPWDIPQNLQPRPGDYSYDLDAALRHVLALRSEVPEDAFTAEALGTERVGSGTVIEGGLVLTMGYLIMESEAIWLSTAEGRAVAGHALAVDYETGFGLVQPLGKLDLPGLAFGDSASLEVGAHVVLASAGGRAKAIETRVVARQEFAGYWEYLIDDAIFTAPAHPFWGGAALLAQDGRLTGVGSLVLQQGDERGHRTDMNMVVPTSLLLPNLQELVRHGRLLRPARPWLGLFAMDTDDAVVIGATADGGPADRAGIKPGDRVIDVDGEEVPDLAAFWRRVWSAGAAGARVPITVGRDDETHEVVVHSTDRASMLRAPRMH